MDYRISSGWAIAIGALAVWDLIWRGIALWESGRRRQKVWFIFLLVINSVGILPIVYLLIGRRPQAPPES